MTQTTTEVEPLAIPGIESLAPWHHPWPAWKAILKRIYVMDGYHNLSLMAAGVAFYAFLSFVPLLGAVVMLYGLVANPATVADHMRTIIDLVPPDAAQLIQDQLTNVAQTAASKAGLGFFVALIFSIYGAMRASGAIIQALSVIYEEEDGRSIVAVYWLSARLTMVTVAAGVIGLFAAIVLGYLGNAVTVLGKAGVVIIQALTWIVAAGIASWAFGFIYRYGPDRADARWQWLTIGSIAATILWLLATVLFGVYVANFANYNATYGSLGAVVVLMMWLWVSAYAVLIGAEINAEAERQTGIDTTTGAPRPRGERGATMADTLPSHRQNKPRRDKY
ncbi:YihY/virulence factor BrkB family protein [Hephaestia mangrovi]|uniref:YihY/virulence factor BrkB family protein n=1 Tax=Hephaestia mangrovi TaxID=2873268 RepID=UPI001CA79091|nr:YihY/virulence factor BrkB family protein [Hephaestia mangrovi]MBY8827601.1 YihY/virulence factor BrkB family protein [Hephaestia mangrovi]